MQDEMTPEEAKAALGHSTGLIDQMLMMQGQQNGTMHQETAPQEPQNATQQQFDPQMISDIVKQAIQEELGGIKDEIAKVIEDDKNEQD